MANPLDECLRHLHSPEWWNQKPAPRAAVDVENVLNSLRLNQYDAVGDLKRLLDSSQLTQLIITLWDETKPRWDGRPWPPFTEEASFRKDVVKRCVRDRHQDQESQFLSERQYRGAEGFCLYLEETLKKRDESQ